MFSHVFLGVSHFERALGFYSALMNSLGIAQRFCEPGRPWAGWHSAGATRPLLVIAAPHNGLAHEAGNGQMVALLANSRAQVRLAHETALRHGGSDEGAPGLRPQYHPHYYGAYFRDPDGNKLCVACHEPEAPAPAA